MGIVHWQNGILKTMLDPLGSTTSCLNISDRSSAQACVFFRIDKDGGGKLLSQWRMSEN